MFHLRSTSVCTRLVSVIASMLVAFSQCLPVAAESADLNLRSARRTAEAPRDLSSPVTIMNGGKAKEVSAGMALTAAQALAVTQILQDGVQSVVLNGHGRAVGGTVDLTGMQSISSLVVPRGVTVYKDFGASAPLEMAGNFVNAGAFYALSTNAAMDNALVSANNIRNLAGALLTSVLPQGGVSGVTGAISNLNLSLVATDTIFNAGTISSAGNLNLVAGNQIVNATEAGLAAMSASGSVNIATQALFNSGVIQAANNINVAQQVIRNAELSALASHLAQSQAAFDVLAEVRNLGVDNTGGVLEAPGGSINFDHANGVKGTFLSVFGGGLLSPEVNADAGTGSLGIGVQDMTGEVNVIAGTANVGSASDLNLGHVEVSGDPTFYSQLGDIALDGNPAMLFNESIALLAGKDVLLGNFTVQARNNVTGQGFNITIVAGGNLTATPGAPQFDSSILAGQTVKVSGASQTGGKIACDGCLIDSSSQLSALNGGNIVLAAYRGSGADSGDIALTNADLRAHTNVGQAGNITMIAGRRVVLNATDIALIGPSGAPKLTVTVAQPAGSITADFFGSTKGALKPGGFVGAPGLADITLDSTSIAAPSGIVSLKAAEQNGLDGLAIDSDSAIDVSGVGSGAAGGSITLSNTGAILLEGDLFADGADNLFVPVPGAAGPPGGAGGVITITATGGVTGTGSTISAVGGLGGEGQDGAAGVNGSFSGSAGGAGGAGGRGGTVTFSEGGGNLIAASIDVSGGDGGDAGDGGSAFLTNGGGSGGAGGKGGAGGAGGRVTFKLGLNPTITPGIVAQGGDAGEPGAGGAGGANLAGVGGSGGTGGAGGIGGKGGSITATGKNSVQANSLRVEGGNGGSNGDGGEGGDGSTQGGRGGSVLAAGGGGAGGVIKVTAVGDAIGSFLGASGGFGGTASGDGGAGGDATGAGNLGGAGGNAGAAGAGGKGGSITYTSKSGSVKNVGLVPLDMFSTGGSGGVLSGDGGAGGSGSGGTGGAGGRSSTGAAGGAGGKITLTAKQGDITNANGPGPGLDVNGGAGVVNNSSNSVGGTGGHGDTAGGAGGPSGQFGAGGKGGQIKLSARNVGVGVGANAIGPLTANGGAGGEGILSGGEGGGSDAVAGAGGSGLTAAAGGAGGKISVKATTGAGITGTEARGGTGGTGASGGDGGDGGVAGGNGGNAGNGGAGGKGGSIKVPTGIGTDVSGGSGGNGVAPGTTPGDGGNPGGSTGQPGVNGADGANGKVKLTQSFDDIEVEEDPLSKRLKRQGQARGRSARVARSAPVSETESSPYKPVRFVQPMLRLTERAISARNVLIAPNRDVVAHAGAAYVKVGRGAAAFLVNNGREVSILSLHDGTTGDIVVTVGSQEIELRSGEQVVITESQTLSFADLNPVPGIACRDLREHPLADGRRAFVAQISLASAIENLRTLKELAASTQAYDRRVYERILKNAAILHMVTSRKGPYKTWSKPAITAKTI